MRFRFVLALALLIVACSSSRNAAASTRSDDRGKKSLMDTHRKEVVESATALVGSRYRYGGTTPQGGFDCSGFTSYVMQHNGLSVPRTSSAQAHSGRTITADKAQPGDLVFFGKGKHVDHVAIVVKSNRNCLQIVHSSSSGGVRIDDVLHSAYWKKRMLHAVDMSSL